MEADDLAALDEKAPGPLRALTHDRPPPSGSHATPHAFVCSDGRTYWVKRNAQHGLIAELVAGRLGARIGAAPNAHPVEVPQYALPADGTANHLLGLGVGILDEPSMENFRQISEKAPDGNLDPSLLDAPSVARVIVFQSWIGAEDTQVLVDLRSGRLLSIDHGALTAVGSAGSAPTVVVAAGIPDALGGNSRLALAVVSEIEAAQSPQRALNGLPDSVRTVPADERYEKLAVLPLDTQRRILRTWIEHIEVARAKGRGRVVATSDRVSVIWKV